ncbi:MAG: PHP domain-containing protein [Sumerlaeia bacterium]
MVSVPSPPPFLPCLVRSDYAPGGQSLARLEDIFRRAAQLGLTTLALADPMSLAQVPDADAAARRWGITPIFGLEIRVTPFMDREGGEDASPAWLYAADTAGWQRLVALLNDARGRATQGKPPVLSWADVFREPRGLVLLLGGERGELTQAACEKRDKHVEALIATALRAFGKRRLGLALPRPVDAGSVRAARALWTLAQNRELLAIAAPPVRCALPEDDLAWNAIRRGRRGEQPTTLSDLARPLREREHLPSLREAAELYADFPGAVENSGKLFTLCRPIAPDGGAPRFARRFPRLVFERGVDADSWVWNTVFERAAERYGDLPARWRERLDEEFRAFAEASLMEGLACMARLAQAFDQREIPRGPGAGFLTDSLVAALLGITRVDPLRHDLPFALPADVAQRPFRLDVPSGALVEAERILRGLFPGFHCEVGRWMRWTPALALDRLRHALKLDSPRMPSPEDLRTARESDAIAREESAGDPDLSLGLDDPRGMAWLLARLEDRPRLLEPVRGLYALTAESAVSAVPLAAGTLAEWDRDAMMRVGAGLIGVQSDDLLDLAEEGAEWLRRTGRRSFRAEATALDDPEAFAIVREGATSGIGPLDSPVLKRTLRALQPTDFPSLQRAIDRDSAAPDREPVAFDRLRLGLECAAVRGRDGACFYAAALSQAQGDPRRVAMLLAEARREGLEIAPPDVNLSQWRWSPEGRGLRVGLMVVKGFPRSAYREVADIRRSMLFADTADLLRRTNPAAVRRLHIEALARAGALDGIAPGRAAILSLLPRLFDHLRPEETRDTQAMSFFGQDPQWLLEQQDPALIAAQASGAPADPPDSWESLAELDFAATGVVFSLTPEERYTDFLKVAQVKTSASLDMRDRDQVVSLLGHIVGAEPDPQSDTGRWLADCGGFFAELDEHRTEFARDSRNALEPVLVTGELRREGFSWIVRARRMERLSEADRQARRADRLEVDIGRLDQKNLKRLMEVLKAFPGNVPVMLNEAPAEKSRLLNRLAARRVMPCPLLEVRLNMVLNNRGWRLYVDGVARPLRVVLNHDSSDTTERRVASSL